MSKTKTWEQYEQGIEYKNRIGLYSTVDLNERFYAGDQWVGIPHEGLPTPVVNFIKYASAWKIAAVTDRRLELNFFAEGEDDGQDIGTYAEQISAYCDMIWERLKMDYLTKEGLKQAAITGDYIQYFYWDEEQKTGQALTGDINTMLIDNVNYYPGNPNDPDVQRQPYIILVFREMLARVKEEAEANGCTKLDEITADEEWEYQWNVKTHIEKVVNGDITWNGFRVRYTGTSHSTMKYFRSRNYSTSAYRPRLVIDYTQVGMQAKVNGTWKNCLAKAKVNGSWRLCKTHAKTSGTWKQCK